MERHKHNAYQQILYSDLCRISTLTDRRIFDRILHRMLFAAGGSPNSKIANGASGFFPDDSCLVEYVSGDRSTGVTFKILVGLGFKKFATGQPDEDSPAFQPIYVASEQSFVTDNSDPTNPRIDRLYIKPAIVDADQASVNVIDPNPPNNITSELRYRESVASYEYAYKAGTPAASPSPPPAPSGYTDADAIAEILIQPGSGSFNVDDLDDLRTLFEMDDQLVPAVTSLPAGSITVSPAVMGESNAQDALEALETEVGAVVPKGLLVGRLEYVNTQSVKLARIMGSDIRIEIDGEVLTSSSDITFDITSHLEGGQTEGASEPIYLYVYDSASTILQKVSQTAPVLNPANKCGYHPTNTGWRCIGSVWNDSSGNFVPGRWVDGWHEFYDGDSDQHYNLGTTVPTAWTSRSLNVPLCAAAVRILAHARINSASVVFGTSDAPGTLPSSAPGSNAHRLSASGMQGVLARLTSDMTYNEGEADQFDLPISDASSPAIRWGILREYTTGTCVFNELRVLAYYDLFAPRY